MSSHIWRYLDLSKLIYLVDNAALHFTRIVQFKDKFEGSYPIKNLEDWNERYPTVGDFSHWRKFVCVSCWYESENESAAMWELYSRDDQGVAICSTKDKLKKSFDGGSDDVHFDNVKYIDFIRDKGKIESPLDVSLYKRIEFGFEREFRGVLFEIPENDGFENGFPNYGSVEKQKGFPKDGQGKAVKPEVLIEKLVVSPYAKPWYKKVVKDVLEKYKLSSVEVKESELAVDPVYPKQ